MFSSTMKINCYPVVIVDDVPAHLEDLVRKAARECAPGAILIEED